jgi:hypothetical protein
MACVANRRRDGGARRIAIAAFCVLAAPAFAGDAPPRYAVRAELRPLGVSADGRFGLDATARFQPGLTSADGRFALEAVNVPEGGCEDFADPLFSDGFEAQ